MRWKGKVVFNGLIREKLFSDGSRKSKREAVIWEVEARKNLEENRTKTSTVEETVTESSVTLLDWVNSYLDYSKMRHAQKTYKEKVNVFQEMLRSGMFEPDMPVADIQASVALKYLSRQAVRRSGYSANKDRKNLLAAWRWGRRYIPGFSDHPCPFDVEKFPEVRHPRYIPPEEDFWAILNAAEKQEKVMLYTFLYTAARRSEIFRLTWEDVDFGRNRVRLWARKREGGSMEPDWIPMTSKLRAVIRNWWHERPVKDTPYVFVVDKFINAHQHTYGKPFVYNGKMMRRLCEKAGVRPFGYHAIRHLTASILFQNGESLQVIQSVLRHKSARTTERYLHSLGLEAAREGLEKISRPADIIPLSERPVGGDDGSGVRKTIG